MLNKDFNKNILDIINTVAFDLYCINLDKKYACSCVDGSTKQGDVGCKKCLGIGYKIKIRKVKGHIQYSTSDTVRIGTMYNFTAYIPYSGFKIKADDYIVFNNETVGIIQTSKPFFSDTGTPIYYSCIVTPKKQYNNIFIKNFLSIVGDE